jgi:bis(5'-nucleosyl)-tetraphosphatase (symmetrical)
MGVRLLMPTYAIGDIQGCFDELQQLLQLINFDKNKDQLWFVGDLVNRGPKSLAVLRLVKNLPNAIVVLGNHDLHLLTIFNQIDPIPIKHTCHEILQAPDCHELIDWLRKRPLLHHDKNLGFVMVHAGIYPNWTLEQAKICAQDAEKILQCDNYTDYLEHMYGNEPNIWHENLTKIDRFRFIINCFTRMRFSDKNGKLDLVETGSLPAAPAGFMPWFKVPKCKARNYKIIFGHWAALEGKVASKNIYALDTGCVWGGSLTAMCLQDGRMFHTPCKRR